jgi:hypothetical protein
VVVATSAQNLVTGGPEPRLGGSIDKHDDSLRIQHPNRMRAFAQYLAEDTQGRTYTRHDASAAAGGSKNPMPTWAILPQSLQSADIRSGSPPAISSFLGSIYVWRDHLLSQGAAIRSGLSRRFGEVPWKLRRGDSRSGPGDGRRGTSGQEGYRSIACSLSRRLHEFACASDRPSAHRLVTALPLRVPSPCFSPCLCEHHRRWLPIDGG